MNDLPIRWQASWWRRSVTAADAIIALQIVVSGEYSDNAGVYGNECVNVPNARMILQATPHEKLNRIHRSK
ncbi:MAG: hypothetical protein GWP10_10155 [Nitrospiraceae bacterium]|nr:hypothetical protein [Nitrospiraceae bacterium]